VGVSASNAALSSRHGRIAQKLRLLLPEESASQEEHSVVVTRYYIGEADTVVAKASRSHLPNPMPIAVPCTIIW
jgi:hypothetical protein